MTSPAPGRNFANCVPTFIKDLSSAKSEAQASSRYVVYSSGFRSTSEFALIREVGNNVDDARRCAGSAYQLLHACKSCGAEHRCASCKVVAPHSCCWKEHRPPWHSSSCSTVSAPFSGRQQTKAGRVSPWLSPSSDLPSVFPTPFRKSFEEYPIMIRSVVFGFPQLVHLGQRKAISSFSEMLQRMSDISSRCPKALADSFSSEEWNLHMCVIIDSLFVLYLRRSFRFTLIGTVAFMLEIFHWQRSTCSIMCGPLYVSTSPTRRWILFLSPVCTAWLHTTLRPSFLSPQGHSGSCSLVLYVLARNRQTLHPQIVKFFCIRSHLPQACPDPLFSHQVSWRITFWRALTWFPVVWVASFYGCLRSIFLVPLPRGSGTLQMVSSRAIWEKVNGDILSVGSPICPLAFAFAFPRCSERTLSCASG